MEFRVLGPVEVRDGDRLIEVPTAKARSLLAALLLRANQLVTVDELVDQIWDGSPPASPRSALQTSVQRLRRALGDTAAELIRSRPRGYLIALEPSQLDLLRFRDLVERGQQAQDPASRYKLLRAALALWRGQPLAGMSSESLLRDEAPRLDEERLAAQEQLIDARLELGQHAGVIPELTALTGRFPLRERPWAQLMLALYRCGRQADALQAYRTVSRHLADELGVDPCDELQRLHRAILAADPSLAVAAAAPSASSRAPALRGPQAPGSSWTPQCQLPLDVGDFVGRVQLVDRIEGLLADDSFMPIVTLSGAPGVGKSALAVRVAHRLRPRFPDGQWYVRLGGASSPRDPAEVLAELLRSSGVERADVPERLDTRAAALRARLADRRVLLLLDDVASAEQVEPLLPGTAGCAVLATGRQDLSSLGARYMVHAMTLDVLAPAEAEALLTRVLGAGRAGADAAGVAQLARLCAYLPLALRITAANLASRPGARIARLVADLRGGDRLSRLTLPGDRTAAVRAAFDHAAATLEPEPRRLFGLLGLVPGPDFTAEAAAALLGADGERAGYLLDVLANASLLQRHAADRYLFHDLLRLYAAERAAADPERHAAWRRLCDWYLAIAGAAVRFDYPALVELPPAADAGDRMADRFGDGAQAQAWLDAERANLVAAAARAADAGPYPIAWQLADALRTYLHQQQHLPEWRSTAEAGLRAAEAAGDRLAQAAMHHSLGVLHERRLGVRAAISHQRAALDRYRQAGCGPGEAAALYRLGVNHFVAGAMPSATAVLEQSVTLIRRLGIARLLGAALNCWSIVHMLSGDLRQALRCNAEAFEAELPPRSALLINRGGIRRLLGEYDAAAADVTAGMALGRERKERQAEAGGHDELARIWIDAGRLDLACEHAMHTLRLAREADDAWSEAGALVSLGDLHRLEARPDQARASYTQAMQVAHACGLRIHEAEALLGLAATHRYAGQPDAARRYALLAMDAAQTAGLRILHCQVLYVLAATSHDLGEPAKAARWAEHARRIQEQTGYHPPAHLTAPLSRPHQGLLRRPLRTPRSLSPRR